MLVLTKLNVRDCPKCFANNDTTSPSPSSTTTTTTTTTKHNSTEEVKDRKLSDGTTFTGTMKDGNLLNGKLVYPLSKDVNTRKEYTGNFLNDIPNGHGTMIFNNGDEYAGDWINGIFNYLLLLLLSLYY